MAGLIEDVGLASSVSGIASICFYGGMRFHKWMHADCEKKNVEEKKVLRNILTQSQCTYSWYNSNPRFIPLSEVASGAWPISLVEV